MEGFLDKRYDIGLGLFSPSRQYTIDGNPSQFPGTFGLSPGTVESDSDLFFVPNFGAKWRLGENAAFGLSIYGQGGMNTDYPTGTFFGTSPTGVDLSQLFIVPSYSVVAADDHAFGFGLVVAYQTFEAQGLEAFGGFSRDPGALTNRGADDSTGFGFKVGYLGKLTERFNLSLAYQSEIDMDAFGRYAGLFAGRGDFDIPSNVTVGFAAEVAQNAWFVFDVQEIYYTDVEAVSAPLLPNIMQGPLGGNRGAGFGWEDMTVVKLGFQWGDPDAWTWRLGASTTDQPIPESEVLFNILAPGVMEEHFTAGFSKAVGEGSAFNMSLMYAPPVSVLGANPLEVPGLQTIELEMEQWDLEFGFSWGF